MVPQKREEPNSVSSKTGRLLEEYSVAILNTVNSRNFNNPSLKHISQAYKVMHDSTVLTDTEDQFLDVLHDIIKQCPEYRMDFISTDSTVDEEKGKAMVWVTHSVTGFPDEGLARESVKLMKWERNKGRWI